LGKNESAIYALQVRAIAALRRMTGYETQRKESAA
jgi:hypothetical protein